MPLVDSDHDRFGYGDGFGYGPHLYETETFKFKASIAGVGAVELPSSYLKRMLFPLLVDFRS